MTMGDDLTVLPGELRFIRAVHRHGMQHANGWMDDSFSGPSQTQLAAEIQLSRPTVSGLTQRAERVLADQDGGIRFSPSRAGLALGIDFGQNHHRLALADVHGRLFSPPTVPGARPPFEIPAPRGPARLSIDWAKQDVPRLLQAVGRSTDDVSVVGVSLPGPVNRQTARLQTAPGDMDKSWEIIDLKEELRRELGLPAPTIESDFHASCVAEHLWGSLQGCTDALYAKISQRCACALVLNDQVYRGADGLAGRLGCTQVQDGDETGWTLIERVFSLQALREKAGEKLTPQQLVLRAQTDARLKDAFARGARALGFALAPIIDAVNPATVVIGGALGTASLTWIASDLLDGIMALDPTSPVRSTITSRLRPGKFARASAVHGVIGSALQNGIASCIAKAIRETDDAQTSQSDRPARTDESRAAPTSADPLQ
jgi:predicted NBD/HSP70 family sugar kinase